MDENQVKAETQSELRPKTLLIMNFFFVCFHSSENSSIAVNWKIQSILCSLLQEIFCPCHSKDSRMQLRYRWFWFGPIKYLKNYVQNRTSCVCPCQPSPLLSSSVASLEPSVWSDPPASALQGFHRNLSRCCSCSHQPPLHHMQQGSVPWDPSPELQAPNCLLGEMDTLFMRSQ